MRLRIALGPAGYGIYLMLVENIYQTGKPIDSTRLNILAYEFHAEEADVRSVLTDFALFVETPASFTLPDPIEPAQPTPTDSSDQSDQPDDEETEIDEEFYSLPIIEQLNTVLDKGPLRESIYSEYNRDYNRFVRARVAIASECSSFPNEHLLVRELLRRARL